MQTVYLTRRNLVTLLNKLDRNRKAFDEVSKCTIIKQDTVHPKYQRSDMIRVTAVEDFDHYTSGDGGPGKVLPADVSLSKSSNSILLWARSSATAMRACVDNPRYPHADEIEGNL